MSNRRAMCEIVVGVAQESDLCIDDYGDIAELAADLALVLGDARRVVLDFRAAAGTHMPVPDAIRVLCDALDKLSSSPEVVIHVASTKVADLARELLRARGREVA